MREVGGVEGFLDTWPPWTLWSEDSEQRLFIEEKIVNLRMVEC